MFEAIVLIVTMLGVFVLVVTCLQGFKKIEDLKIKVRKYEMALRYYADEETYAEIIKDYKENDVGLEHIAKVTLLEDLEQGNEQ